MVSQMTEFKQLDIYWVDLEPTKGTETKKLRPCVIVQSDLVNIQSKTPSCGTDATQPQILAICSKSDSNQY